MKAVLPALLAAALLGAVAFAARSQNYSADWHAVAGGGGVSTNGGYSVSGTAGQAATATMTGGPYAVNGGFWSVTVMQTAGAPVLAITKAGAGVVVSWPLSATNYVLQQNISVTNPSGWANYSGTVVSNATGFSAAIPAPSGTLFFRLMQ